MDIQTVKNRYDIIGNDPKLVLAINKAIQVAPTDLSILVTGESGVGKEIFARMIHDNSTRKHKKLVSVNCGAIPEGTIESELFGHIKGSFTGADKDRKGYFEEADGGTIFLDEVGELPLAMQVKLLRVLENGEIIPVGSSSARKINVRVVAATNEKRLGFKTFKDFVKSADFVQMTDVGGGSYTVALAEQKVAVEEDSQMILAKALKRKGWDMFPRNMLKKIYAEACDITSFVPMNKQDLVQEIVAKNIAGTTSSIINRALGTFFKAKLVTISGGDDKLWTLTETNQYWKEIDKAMLDRLRVSLKETGQKVPKKDIVAILYGKYADGEAEKLV